MICRDTRLSRAKQNMADELYNFCHTNRVSSTNCVDMDSCSDDDFEKVSISCSEPPSADETDVYNTESGHMTNGAVVRPSVNAAPLGPSSFQVLKPPTVPVASVPSVLAGTCQHTSVKGREERSPLFSELIELATNIEQLVV